ncbi:MAG: 16S rRNA pseudouridine(516) synthase [Comamonadaceae bacterium]|nr:16S rRNA pseudouridine(516) synthase [Comamonadaceae bacterium]
MRLADVLYSQGFGTRRVCAGMVEQGMVAVHRGQASPEVCLDPSVDVVQDGLVLHVQGIDWPYHAKAYLMMHKPAAVECSQRPSAYPSVYSLLPAPLRERPVRGASKGVQAVGRLDQDTTGLLLFSDDGQFIHRMASPKRHVPKIYRVVTRHAVTEVQQQRLLEGVVLEDDPVPVCASRCTRLGECALDLTLTQGKYHQVKRMLAAVGNRVEHLHRWRIGALDLPQDLAPGQWRWLSPDELARAQDAAL